MRFFLIITLAALLFISCDDAKPSKDYNNDTDTVEITDNHNITADEDLVSDSDEAEDFDISVDEETDDDAVIIPDEDETAQDEDSVTTPDEDIVVIDEDETATDEDTVTAPDEDDIVIDEDSTVTPDEDETAQDDDAVIVPDEDETTVDADNEINDEDIPDTLFIRAIAGNISSGNYQSYDPGHGIRIFKGLQGDIFMVQEFNTGKNGSTMTDRDMVDEMCGTECYYTVGTGQIPNGVVSRWPITSSGYWDDPNIDNRDLDWAVIDIPGPKDIFAISVHISTTSSKQGPAAKVIAEEVYDLMQANADKYYFILGGDFNGSMIVSDTYLGKFNGANIFYVAGPHPVSEDGDEDTNSNRSSQYDFVLADYNLHTFQIPVKYTDFTYTNGLVFDTREYSQAELNANFSPALTGDSGSSQMQHMAIVKDFNITLEK